MPRSLRVAALLLALLACSSVSEAGPITIAWDPNSEPEVSGYIVLVGIQSRVYTETYDVGASLSFVYPFGRAGLRYYFAVAAYTADGLMSGYSEEVSAHLAESAIFQESHAPGAAPLPVTGAALPASPRPLENVRERVACADGAPSACYALETMATGLGQVGQMVATGDGRLFFVEEGQRIRTITQAGLVPEPALVVDHLDARITGLALDPAFGATHAIVVGETDATATGAEALTLSRYRELQNVLAQRARIVSELPIPRASEVPFAVDEAGRIIVAMPATAEAGRSGDSAYGGFLLRFNADGSAPAENRAGSPIFGHAYSRTTAIGWDAARAGLWLAGDDPRWMHSLAWMPVPRGAASGPYDPTGVAPPHLGDGDALIDVAVPTWASRSAPRLPASAGLAAVTASGQVRLGFFRTSDAAPEWRHLPLGSDPVIRVGAGSSGELFVAQRITRPADGSVSYSIVRLAPIED